MIVNRKSVLIAVAVLTAFGAVSAARAEPRVLVLDPAASKVTFTLEATAHTVEGKMALKSGRILFDPANGSASGEVVVNLAGAETGNGSRDTKMREDVLETGKYPVATFHAEHLEGTVAPSGKSKVTLTGTLSFHGANHKIKLPAEVELQGNRLKIDGRLTIPFVAWGLHDPSVLFLRVEKEVTVHIQAQGSVSAAGGQ